jgi:hypothetical protein
MQSYHFKEATKRCGETKRSLFSGSIRDGSDSHRSIRDGSDSHRAGTSIVNPSPVASDQGASACAEPCCSDNDTPNLDDDDDFIENDIRNRLETHLDAYVQVYTRDLFDVESFPYHELVPECAADE